MLDSVRIQRRQSEIRQSLAELAGKENPSEDEIRQMTELDREYQTGEVRYRAALVAEDTERREAGADLETREGSEWAEMVAGFELRQVALNLDTGRALEGVTAEVVAELRNSGGYRGTPVPFAALEVRVGETIASGTPDPMQTRPIVDRLFPGSVAAAMGGQMIHIDHGSTEWPVTTGGATVGWQATELGNVGGPSVFATTEKSLSPKQTLGVQMRISRKAMMQSGTGLEAAIRRDMHNAMQTELDRAIFDGAGTSGEPHGIIAKGNATYGITGTAVNAAPTWGAIRAAVIDFMAANAASGPGSVSLLIRPEIWGALDDAEAFNNTGITEWARLTGQIGKVVQTTNAIADPGTSTDHEALLTTSAGGLAPFFVGLWGAIDLIRDPFTDAQSGGLRLTALATMDIAVARPSQLRVLTGLDAS